MRFSRSLCKFLAVAAWVPYGGCLSADTSQDVPIGTRVKIASANLENLWDGDPNNSGSAASVSPSWEASLPSSSLLYHDFDPAYSNWYDPDILTKKVDKVLKAVHLLGIPDILAAQEIESAHNHSAVQSLPYGDSTLGAEMKKLGYLYFYLGKQAEEKPVSVTPAIWSKIPLEEEESVTVDIPESPMSSRDIQVVRAKIGATEFLLFNNHWKSKNGGGEAIRRKIAVALRARINAEQEKNPDLGVIVVGDLNSDYFEEPIRALGVTGSVREMTRGTRALYDLWLQQPAENRWEYSFDGLRGTLSQMLISQQFFRGGLRYVDHSFQAVGQTFSPGEAGLLGPDGMPYGWQVQHYGAKVVFAGEGFSDHLPLLAEFEVVSPESAPAYKKSEESIAAPQGLRFDKVPVCKEGVDPILNVEELTLAMLKENTGACVKIEIPQDKPALPFSVRGKYQSVYVNLSLQDGSVKLGVAMTRRWDWRPNIDDSRLNQNVEEKELHGFSAHKDHPHSNKCFQRKVLQGNGGELRYAVGRIGYYVDGYMSIVIPTREPRDLILEKLPAGKQKACPW